MNPILLLTGYKRLRAQEGDAVEVLNLCLCYGINYTDFSYGEAREISFCCSLGTARRLQALCRERGIDLEVEEGGGLPLILWRYRRRAGLLVGTLLALCLVLLSRRFVWDVRVTGNQTMTESEVHAELRACGFGVGSYIPGFHAGELENRVLMASDRISWISIYLDGTVARVQIIEHVAAPPKEDASRPANLIAACDGQIELVELYRGNCTVRVGQAVRKGELLVSGIYDSATVGYRYTRAAGRILARTERSFCVEIPLTYLEKHYEEAKYSQIELKFFDYSLKIFKSSGNVTDTYDIIKEEIDLDLLGRLTLPVGLVLEKAVPYTQESALRTYEEALELAYARLEQELAALSEEAELLSKSVSTSLTETSLVLECTVSCVQDIAVCSEFEVTE